MRRDVSSDWDITTPPVTSILQAPLPPRSPGPLGNTSWLPNPPAIFMPPRHPFPSSRSIRSPLGQLTLTITRSLGAVPHFLTESGTLIDEEIRVNRRGFHGAGEVADLALEDLEAVKVIGKGSSGLVQLVIHKLTNETYALKNMQMELGEEQRQHMLRELRLHHQFKCPYVVRCYQSFYIDGKISMVLEYMDGGSLADVLSKRGPISEPFIAEIATQALRGLDTLHSTHHVIHRDVKPSNLLLSKSGTVKISDFGVSAALESTLDVRMTFVGTCTYMSPERIEGKVYNYTSDIWALGLALLECSIGRFPYSRPGVRRTFSNFFELMSTIVREPAPNVPETCSTNFRSFIDRCLQKDPSQRATAQELLLHPFITERSQTQVNFTELWCTDY
eukprot:TRINITY_DN2475_c0_g1_i2.p1 TRINITY_DN2475_c0_g1~~TRINITY_DN2475_c0_g1_i2.p1  ORF type:complete len:390 (+),score=52.08 TRINITY_DN2475_c0_g1_i2:175-1344(+)